MAYFKIRMKLKIFPQIPANKIKVNSLPQIEIAIKKYFYSRGL